MASSGVSRPSDYLRDALLSLHKAIDLSSSEILESGKNDLDRKRDNKSIVELLAYLQQLSVEPPTTTESTLKGLNESGTSPSLNEAHLFSRADPIRGLSIGDRLSDEFVESCYSKLVYVHLRTNEPILALHSIKTCLLRITSLSSNGR